VKRYVLDASALLAFFQDEPGAIKVQELLTEAREADRPLLLSVVNWGEVYYVAWQRMGEAAARERVEEIARLPIDVVDADLETAKLAATLKAQHKLPYADCFAAALAKQRKAILVTTDRDFSQIEKEVAVLWTKSS
jgi:ribonuclease VapC